MNTEEFFDGLLHITTNLKSTDCYNYFYSIGFALFDKSPHGLIFNAKSVGVYNNMYHIDIDGDKITSCVYVTRLAIDFEKLIDYASKEHGFSILLNDNEDNTTILIKGKLKCFLRKRVLDDGISYKIRVIK